MQVQRKDFFFLTGKIRINYTFIISKIKHRQQLGKKANPIPSKQVNLFIYITDDELWNLEDLGAVTSTQILLENWQLDVPISM